MVEVGQILQMGHCEHAGDVEGARRFAHIRNIGHSVCDRRQQQQYRRHQTRAIHQFHFRTIRIENANPLEYGATRAEYLHIRSFFYLQWPRSCHSTRGSDD